MLSPQQIEALADQHQRELLESAQRIRRGRHHDTHVRTTARHRLRQVAASCAQWFTGSG